MKQPKPAVDSSRQETRAIKRDLLLIAAVNAVLAALLAGLYVWERSSGGLSRTFARFLDF